MNLDEHIAQLVRDTVMPMLAERFDQLEERLVERLRETVQAQPAPASAHPLLTIVELAKRFRVDKRSVKQLVKVGEFRLPIGTSRACTPPCALRSTRDPSRLAAGHLGVAE